MALQRYQLGERLGITLLVGIGVEPPYCCVEPTSLAFGTLLVGTELAKSFTVTNTTAVTLSGLFTVAAGVAPSGLEFSLESGGGDYILAPGGSREVSVLYSPTDSGSDVATVSRALAGADGRFLGGVQADRR